jgi:hypothetical protein
MDDYTFAALAIFGLAVYTVSYLLGLMAARKRPVTVWIREREDSLERRMAVAARQPVLRPSGVVLGPVQSSHQA